MLYGSVMISLVVVVVAAVKSRLRVELVNPVQFAARLNHHYTTM